MTNPFKLFFVPIIKLFSIFYPQLLIPRPSPSAEAINSEVVAPLVVGDDNAVDQAEAPIEAADFVVMHNVEWAEIVVIGFCLSSAIDMAILSLQVHSQLPALFHLFSLAILLAFASIVVSKFINPKFLLKVQVLEKCGVTAFFKAITIQFPLYLKFASWTVYAISALAILISSCF